MHEGGIDVILLVPERVGRQSRHRQSRGYQVEDASVPHLRLDHRVRVHLEGHKVLGQGMVDASYWP